MGGPWFYLPKMMCTASSSTVHPAGKCFLLCVSKKMGHYHRSELLSTLFPSVVGHFSQGSCLVPDYNCSISRVKEGLNGKFLSCLTSLYDFPASLAVTLLLRVELTLKRQLSTNVRPCCMLDTVIHQLVQDSIHFWCPVRSCTWLMTLFNFCMKIPFTTICRTHG